MKVWLFVAAAVGVLVLTWYNPEVGLVAAALVLVGLFAQEVDP